MRLNYYEFPETMSVWDCYCAQVPEDEREPMPEGYEPTDEDRAHWCQMEGISVTTAKKMLKQYGGKAYTLHMERDGGVFETTPIQLKGNNSKFKYNRHL